MTRTFPRKYLAAPAAAIGAAALAFTVLAQPAPASSHTISSGHWDLVAEVDCTANSVELLAENHDAGTSKDLATSTFVVSSTNDDDLVTSDRNKFDPDPFRVLSHDEAEVSSGRMVLGFDVEYATNCGTNTPDVTFKVVSGSTVPTGARAAAYKNTSDTATDLDTATGTGLNGGVVTDKHEDRRWGFSVAGAYGVKVRARVDPGSGFVSDAETVSFDVS